MPIPTKPRPCAHVPISRALDQLLLFLVCAKPLCFLHLQPPADASGFRTKRFRPALSPSVYHIVHCLRQAPLLSALTAAHTDGDGGFRTRRGFRRYRRTRTPPLLVRTTSMLMTLGSSLVATSAPSTPLPAAPLVPRMRRFREY